MRRQHTHTLAYNLYVSVNDSSMGSASGGGKYKKRHIVSVSASPNANHHFVNWSDGGAQTHYITIGSGDFSIQANFAIDQYTITASSNNTSMGTVSGGGTYNYGSIVTLTAMPKTGYQFTGWSGSSTSTSTSITITVSGNATYTANFSSMVIPEYTVSLTANNTTGVGIAQVGYQYKQANGTFTDPEYGTSIIKTVKSGTVIRISGKDASGHEVIMPDKWSDMTSGGSNYDITITSDKTLTLSFKRNKWIVTLQSNSQYGGVGDTLVNSNTSTTKTCYVTNGSVQKFYHTTINDNLVMFKYFAFSDNRTNVYEDGGLTVTKDITITATYSLYAFNIQTLNSTNPVTGKITWYSNGSTPKVTGIGLCPASYEMGLQNASAQWSMGYHQVWNNDSISITKTGNRGLLTSAQKNGVDVAYYTQPIKGSGNFTIMTAFRTPSTFTWWTRSGTTLSNNGDLNTIVSGHGHESFSSSGYYTAAHSYSGVASNTNGRWYVGLHKVTVNRVNKIMPLLGIHSTVTGTSSYSWQYFYFNQNIVTDTPYTLVITRNGNSIQCYINGSLVQGVTTSNISTLTNPTFSNSVSLAAGTIIAANADNFPIHIGTYEKTGNGCADNYQISKISMFNEALDTDTISHWHDLYSS